MKKMRNEMINIMVCIKTIPEVKCVQGLCLWRNSSAEVNEEIFKGSWRGNPERMTNEIAAGFVKSSSIYLYELYACFSIHIDC